MTDMQVATDITENGRSIFTTSPWYPDAPYDAKQVPGGRWDKPNRRWTYPLTLETCHALRAVYGRRLRVGPRLSRWARETMALEDRMRSLGAAQDAELQVVPQSFPRMAAAMGNRTYQRSGARFIAEGRRVGVFDEVGLGKTITALAGIIEAGKFTGRHLVVSNKTSLESVWQDQILHWTEGQGVPFVAQGAAAQRKKVIEEFMTSDAPSRWLMVNPQMLGIKLMDFCKQCKKFEHELNPSEDLEHFTMVHKCVSEPFIHKYPELQSILWDSIIIDEAHKILTTGNKSTKKTAKTQVALGCDALDIVQDGLKLALTGTPARGKELQMWGIMNWLWPTTYSSRWAWVEHYFSAEHNGFGWDIGGLRAETQESFWKAIDRHAIRRTRREVRADLPESESYTEWVPLEDKHRKQYEEFQRMGSVQMDSDELIGDGILSELTRLKQMAFGVWDKPSGSGKLFPKSSPKAHRVVDLLDEYGVFEGDRQDPRHYKYIVSSQFTEVVDFMVQELKSKGVDPLVITGSVTGAKRSAAVRSFQEDPDGPRVLVMNTYAGGESITLDRYCDTMFILDETFVAADQTQLYGRIDNRSVTAEEAVPRRFIHILSKGTIDEQIAELNLSQLQLEHQLLDARRGVDIAKFFHRKELS